MAFGHLLFYCADPENTHLDQQSTPKFTQNH